MRRLLPAALALIAVLAGLACDRVTPVAPVGATITLSINPTRIDARGESATITAIVRREDGTPVNPGTQVNFSTSLGVIDPEIAFTDETGVAKSTLAGDGRIGMAAVAATTGAAAAVEVMVQIGSVAASITLTVTPTDVSKSPPPEGETLELLALVRDDTGAPLADITVSFDADIGRLASGGAAIVTSDLGEASDSLTITRNNIAVLSEPVFLVIAETAIEGGALISDEVEIFVRGVPALLSLQATPGTVPKADGGIVTLLAFVRDNLGDPLPGAIVNFQTDIGTLTSGGAGIATVENGTASDILTVTPTDLASFSPRSFNVRAQTAGLAGSLLEETGTIQIDTASPVASFTMTGASGGTTVTFINNSTGQAPLTYSWDFFNDGTVDSILVTPPPFTASAGNFTVKLTISNALGSDFLIQSVQLPFP